MKTVFDRVTDVPCPVCLELVEQGMLNAEAVMPLPDFPARMRDGRKCCSDCQSAETVMRMGGHPEFSASRQSVAYDRLRCLRLPTGNFMGLVQMQIMKPAGIEYLEQHQAWVRKHGIYELEEHADDND